MRSIEVFIRLALFAFPVLASEGLLPVKRAEGEVIEDRYVVILKDGTNFADVADSTPEMNITQKWTIVNGFAANLTQEGLDNLRAQPNVQSITQDAYARTSATQWALSIFLALLTRPNVPDIRIDAPWGLQRISHREPVGSTSDFALDYTYNYDDSAGKGVDIYIIDTGIQIDHVGVHTIVLAVRTNPGCSASI